MEDLQNLLLHLQWKQLNHEVVSFWEKVQNDEIVGEKKKYLQALFNLNNKLVEKYNSKFGDATGYYMEWVDEKPYSVSLSRLIN
jgi:hypothetical protein